MKVGKCHRETESWSPASHIHGYHRHNSFCCRLNSVTDAVRGCMCTDNGSILRYTQEEKSSGRVSPERSLHLHTSVSLPIHSPAVTNCPQAVVLSCPQGPPIYVELWVTHRLQPILKRPQMYQKSRDATDMPLLSVTPRP